MSEPLDVITMGRVGVDFYPTTRAAWSTLSSSRSFSVAVPPTWRVAAARLGEKSAIITRTGPDPLGEFVHVALRGYGVDDRFVQDVAGLQTPVTFCEMFPPDHFPIYFYRAPKAPDLEIYPDQLDIEAIGAARLFWATVSGLSAEPSRTATLMAMAARQRHHPTILDLDYRPVFWASIDAARTSAREALAHASVAIGNLAEVEMAVGSS